MRHRATTIVGLVLSTAIILTIGTSTLAAESQLGDPGFKPSPEHPVGWRGDWTGRYPGANPPVSWSRRVRGPFSEITYQARKPTGEPGKEASPLEYFTIKDWLVAGPFDTTDPKAAIEQDLLGGEANLSPNEGDKAGSRTWKRVHIGMENQTAHVNFRASQCGHLCVDFVYAFGTFKRDEKLRSIVEGDLSNKIAYAHTYIHSPTGGNVHLTLLNWGVAAKAWLNGKPLDVEADVARNQKEKEMAVTLLPGWNRLLVKVASNDDPAKDGDRVVSRWRMTAYLTPSGPVTYETRNVAWMTPVTGQSVSQPIAFDGKLFFGSGHSDLMCVNQTDGKVLWIHSNTKWDALSTEERAQFKDKAEPWAKQLEEMNTAAVNAINAVVSPQGMSAEQEAALGKTLKEKLDLEAKLDRVFEAIDRMRFPSTVANQWGEAALYSSGNATPCTDGSRIYWACSGVKAPGACIVCCFDPSGKRIWTRLETLATPYMEHGCHTSPFLADGKCIYGGGSRTLAFDAATGKIAWNQKIANGQHCAASPVRVLIGNEPGFLALNAQLFRASDGGKIGGGIRMITSEGTPIVEDGIVYIENYPNKIGSYGTLAALQLPACNVLYTLDWEKHGIPQRGEDPRWIASPLYVDGLVYTLDMTGGLMIVDTKAKKSVYRNWLDWYCRYGYPPDLYGATASPALGGRNVYLVDDSGCTIVLKPGPAYTEAGRNVLENIYNSPLRTPANPNPCKQELFYTSPVFSGDTVFLKGEEYLYALRSR